MGDNNDGISGYGLVRQCRQAESPSSMTDRAGDSNRQMPDASFFSVFLRDYVAATVAKKG
jgi:hypothetical protein